MPTDPPRPTLSSKQARGGVIGGRGYGFQAAYIVSRIPLWLADPDFAQFLQEGAGDVDVRFNRAGGEERWYIQVKNYLVKPGQARKVFAQFGKTDAGSPGTYTRFTLACPGLHDDVKSLRAAVEELRGAAPFYRPGQDAILDNTWAGLEALAHKLKLPVDAAFLVDKTHFDTDLAGLTGDASLCDLFVGRLQRLAAWAMVRQEAAAHAYEKLALLCHGAIRQTCSREQVEALIWEAANLPIAPLFRKAEDTYLRDSSVLVLLSHLKEWKTVHTTVQNLMISTSSIAPQVRGEFTERIAYSIENDWTRFCEPKVTRVHEAFSSFEFVDHPSIDRLSSMLNRDSDQYLARRIGDLRIGDTQSVGRLRSSVYELIDTLKEVLTVADLYIVQITEKLASSLGWRQ